MIYISRQSRPPYENNSAKFYAHVNWYNRIAIAFAIVFAILVICWSYALNNLEPEPHC